MNRRELFAIPSAALVLSACSADTPDKAAAKPAEPITGLRALYQAYGMARSWAPDVKILHVSSIDIDQVKSQPGKTGAWQVVFASEAKGQKRAYVSCVFDVSVTLRKGVFAESPNQWSDDHRAFIIAAAQIDSDKALEVAMKHGAEYTKKNPTMPISYYLEMGRTINMPVWRVIWGESISTSTFSILIEATTGTYISTLS